MQVTIDNTTSKIHSVISVACPDRKGLVYDLMRTLKDIHLRVAYAKVPAGHLPAAAGSFLAGTLLDALWCTLLTVFPFLQL